MALKTRRPTNTPGWDLALITGMPKCGKTFTAAQASASPKVARTFWINYGEPDPDEYGLIEGAEFEIVEWDEYGGSPNIKGLFKMIQDIAAEPRGEDDRPNLIILDSVTRVWADLSDQANALARIRSHRKSIGAKGNVKVEDPGMGMIGDEANTTTDIWNAATDRWNHMLNLLRTHDGPVILTALLKEATIMANGQPTKNKEWKPEAQKNLAADVGLVVEIPAYREHYITGVRSMRFEPVATGVHTAKNRYKDFTMDGLWDTLGITAESKTVAYHQDGIVPGMVPDEDGVMVMPQQGQQQAPPAQQQQAAPPQQQVQAQSAPAPAPPVVQASVDAAYLESVQKGDNTPLKQLWARAKDAGILDMPLPNGATVNVYLTNRAAAVEGAVAAKQTAAAGEGEPERPGERPAGAAAARAQQAADNAASNSKVLLLEELAEQASLAECALTDLTDGDDPGDMDDARLFGFVQRQRPGALAAMRDAGLVVEADAYEAAMQANAIAPWGLLTGQSAAATV